MLLDKDGALTKESEEKELGWALYREELNETDCLASANAKGLSFELVEFWRGDAYAKAEANTYNSMEHR